MVLVSAELPEYNNLWAGAKTLFTTSMGGLNFSDFDDLKFTSPIFSQLIQFLIMIVTNVTLLNFVIAILSNTY